MIFSPKPTEQPAPAAPTNRQDTSPFSVHGISQPPVTTPAPSQPELVAPVTAPPQATRLAPVSTPAPVFSTDKQEKDAAPVAQPPEENAPFVPPRMVRSKNFYWGMRSQMVARKGIEYHQLVLFC